MIKKGPLVFVIVLFILLSLSCTNPITMYFSTQTAIMQTATATMWTPTSTPTKTPTNTPTFTPTPDFLYSDDFEDSDSGWAELDSDNVLREYSDGGYRILVKAANYSAWSLEPEKEDYSDIRIEVDATRIGGPDENDFGILCRYQDNQNYYGLEIGSSGKAIIYLYENGNFTGLSADQFEDVDGINADDVNQIAAVCSGDNFELYVNDNLVASASDSTFREGRVALIVGTFDDGYMDVLFDNFYIRPA